MRSRFARVAAICIVAASLVTLCPPAVERMTPRPGLVRTFYPQPGFRGAPVEALTSNITLAFLDEETALPRQNFSVRWRGFVFVAEPQTIEFFTGGNDEVELRVDGQLLLTRNIRDGMRTVSRRVPLAAGSHELRVDYQQFTGGMALNIQRAKGGQPAGPFLSTELFVAELTVRQAQLLEAAGVLRRATPAVWFGLILVLICTAAVMNYGRWRESGAPKSIRQYGIRLWHIAAPAALAPAVVFVMGPHTIFTTNPGEFAVPFRQIAAPWLLKTAAINWLILLGVGGAVALLSLTATRMYAALLLALGLLLWGQGNLWNANYGVLAGREIDLAEHAGRGPYELGMFAAVMLAAAAFSRHVSRITVFASLVFLAVMTIGAAVTSAVNTQRAEWVEPPADIYRFSASQNVIHIVLDEFQSDLFTDMLEQERPFFDRHFSGFEYFIDHAGSFPTTSFSMPAMLTGREYRNQKPGPEFVREVFARDSIFARVSRAGYDVDAMSIVPPASFEEWLGRDDSPNWSGARFRIRKPFLNRQDYAQVSARQLLELSLFRHVPHAAKAAIAARPQVFYRRLSIGGAESPAETRLHEAANSVAFLQHFIERMDVGRQRPLYKLIHVGVPHRPIVVDRGCRFIGITRITHRNYSDQARCSLELVAALLNRARALGIYDSSVIVISSDHGTDFSPRGFNGSSESLSMLRGPSLPRLGAIAGTAKALMLIKRQNRTGPVAISEAPTSHVDFHATILDQLGLPGNSSEPSMFQRDAKQPRTRSYGMYDFGQRFPQKYLDRVHVLSIGRRVVDADGWQAIETIWSPDASLPSGEVDFLSGYSRLYLGAGWSMERKEAAGNSGPVTFVQPAAERGVLFIPSDASEIVMRASSSSDGPVDVTIDGRPMQPLRLHAGGYRDYSIQLRRHPAAAPLSNMILGFQALTDGGRGFKLDRITIH